MAALDLGRGLLGMRGTRTAVANYQSRAPPPFRTNVIVRELNRQQRGKNPEPL